jgi:hypothetical protein
MMGGVNRVDPSSSVTGRYALYGPIARGGMATVFFGRLRGPAGFARTVAIKRLHPQFAAQPELVTMFFDEARLATRVRSPHVVSTLDVVATGEEVFLVMDYVAGESLARLVHAAGQRGERIPISIAVAILSGALQGLNAAHEARSDAGEPLGLVHRDVSPQNILVGTDGLARVLDFGVAKAAGRAQSTRDGELKGKLSYMPPEQLRHEPLTRRADVYAASVVLWETLTGQRLFGGDDEGAVVTRVLLGRAEPPSRIVARDARGAGDGAERAALEKLDPIVLRGLDRDPSKRFETAGEMAIALEQSARPATAREVSVWLERVAGPVLAERAARLGEIEAGRAAAEVIAIAESSATPRTDEAIGGSVQVTAAASRPGQGRRPPGQARGRLAWIGAAATLAGTIALVLRVRGAPSPPTPAPRPIDSPSAATEATVPPALPDAAATVVITPAATPASASLPPSRSAASAPRKPKPAADCTPPFSWDALGKKHYKAQCL